MGTIVDDIFLLYSLACVRTCTLVQLSTASLTLEPPSTWWSSTCALTPNLKVTYVTSCYLFLSTIILLLPPRAFLPFHVTRSKPLSTSFLFCPFSILFLYSSLWLIFNSGQSESFIAFKISEGELYQTNSDGLMQF